MRRFIYTVIVLFIAALSVSAKRNIAPGEWQAIRSYNGITSIIPSKEKIYVVANGGMYIYDKKTKEVLPFSKHGVMRAIIVSPLRNFVPPVNASTS